MAFNLKLKLLGQYAKFIPAEKIILVSGSTGKSSTLLACQAVLQPLGKIFISQDLIISNPQQLLKLNGNIKKGLFKLNIDSPQETNLSLSLIKAGNLIITNVFPGQNLSTEQLIEEYKLVILQIPQNGAVILNYDDPFCRKLAQNSSREVIFYGTDPKNCHLWAGNIQISKFRVVFELNYGVERVEITTNFVGKLQIYSILAAAALGIKEGLRLTQIKTALEKVYPLPHKMEVIPGFNGSTIIDDSFGGALVDTEETVDVLNYIQARRRILVLGPMTKMGPGDKPYLQIAQKIYQDRIDLVCLGRGEMGYVADELLKLGFIAGRLESDLLNPQIVSGLLQVLAKGDVVLIKGMRESRLDEVVAKITKK